MKEWRVVITLDDGTNTNVSVCPVNAIWGLDGEHPHVVEAAAYALAGFVEAASRESERASLKKRWDER